MLIAHPSYPLFDFLATIQDVKLRPFQIVYDHGWQIDFPTLQKRIGRANKAIVAGPSQQSDGQFYFRERGRTSQRDLCKK